MSVPDPRLHAHRSDLADAALEGRVTAARFVEPHVKQIIEPVTSVHRQPGSDAMQLTQALLGETVKVFHESDGWAWVQLMRDGYVGYVNCNALTAAPVATTHRVCVPASFMYPKSSIKAQPAVLIPMNAQVTVVSQEGDFCRLANGSFVFTAHLTVAGTFNRDFVSTAEMFSAVPYYWGGKTVQGLDCSGLVQLALEACGMNALRDSDMQERTLGAPLGDLDIGKLARGDLVFWSGHVGIMTDAVTLLHANGHHMMVFAEPLKAAADRISARYGGITSIRRL